MTMIKDVDAAGEASCALSFTVNTPVHAHEPIIVELSVRNRSDRPIDVDLGHNRQENLRFRVTTPKGEVMAFQQEAHDIGLVGKVSLAAGETLTQRVAINQWHPFDETGDYSIEVQFVGAIAGRSARPDCASAKLTVRVLSRDSARLAEVCERLADKAISADAEAAAEAAQWLSYVRDEACVGAMVRVLEKSAMAKEYAVSGLARVPVGESVTALAKALRTSDSELRRLIVRALSEMREHVRNENTRNRIDEALRRADSLEVED